MLPASIRYITGPFTSPTPSIFRLPFRYFPLPSLFTSYVIPSFSPPFQPQTPLPRRPPPNPLKSGLSTRQAQCLCRHFPLQRMRTASSLALFPSFVDLSFSPRSVRKGSGGVGEGWGLVLLHPLERYFNPTVETAIVYASNLKAGGRGGGGKGNPLFLLLRVRRAFETKRRTNNPSEYPD